jgi:hypothetical protein
MRDHEHWDGSAGHDGRARRPELSHRATEPPAADDDGIRTTMRVLIVRPLRDM